MSSTEKLNEEQVFKQEASDDELEAVSGGGNSAGDEFGSWHKNSDNCTKMDTRNIYGGKGFPNCAATVEEDSWCGYNDACIMEAVAYQGMETCVKAHA